MNFQRLGRKKRSGVAVAIAVWILLGILMAAVYVLYDWADQYASQYSLCTVNQGLCDPNTTSFVDSYWQWIPVIIWIMTGMIVFRSAQRHPYGE